MRIEETEIKTVTKTEEVITKESIICNKCGNKYENKSDFWDSEIHDFYVDFGYGSSYDMEKWSFDLCDDCLTEIVKNFKHVPDGFKLDDYYSLSNEDHQKVFEHWKETGQWEVLLCVSYDEIVNLNGYFHTEYLNEAIRKFHPDKPLL